MELLKDELDTYGISQIYDQLPNKYWAEAVATAAYITNRTPTTAIKENVTPYNKWYERKPNVENFKVFGCIAYAHIPESQRRKLDKKSKKIEICWLQFAVKRVSIVGWINLSSIHTTRCNL